LPQNILLKCLDPTRISRKLTLIARHAIAVHINGQPNVTKPSKIFRHIPIELFEPLIVVNNQNQWSWPNRRARRNHVTLEVMTPKRETNALVLQVRRWRPKCG